MLLRLLKMNLLIGSSAIIMMVTLMVTQIVNAKPQDKNIFEDIATKGLELAGNVAEMVGNAGMISNQNGFELPFAKMNSSSKIGTGAAFREEKDSSEEDRRRRKRRSVGVDEKYNDLFEEKEHLHRDKRSPCHGGGGGGGGGGSGGGGGTGGGGGGTGGGGIGGGGIDLGGGGGGIDLGGGGIAIDGDYLDLTELRRRANARRRKNASRKRTNSGKNSRRNNGRRRNTYLVKDEANEVSTRRKRQTQGDDSNQNGKIDTKERIKEKLDNFEDNMKKSINDAFAGANSTRRKRQAQMDNGNPDLMQRVKEHVINAAEIVNQSVGKVIQTIKDKLGGGNSNLINVNNQGLMRRKRRAQMGDGNTDFMQRVKEKVVNVADKVKQSVGKVTQTIKDKLGGRNLMNANNQGLTRRKRQTQVDDSNQKGDFDLEQHFMDKIGDAAERVDQSIKEKLAQMDNGNPVFMQHVEEEVSNVAGKIKQSVGKMTQSIKDRRLGGENSNLMNANNQGLIRRKRRAQMGDGNTDFMQRVKEKVVNVADKVKQSVGKVTQTIKDKLGGRSLMNANNQRLTRRRRQTEADDQNMQNNGKPDLKQRVKEKISNVAEKVKQRVGNAKQKIKDKLGGGSSNLMNANDQALTRSKRQTELGDLNMGNDDFGEKIRIVAESLKNSVLNVTQTIKDQFMG